MPVEPPQGIGIKRLLAVMTQLRSRENGCPWDIEQNFSTIAPYTIEEAYEVADAVERDDMSALKDELGDLLFQVVFHGRLAEELALFSFDDIASHCADKMVRRHPHVFSDKTGIKSASDQTVAWEDVKAAERAIKKGTMSSALDGVTIALPALTRAIKIQRRAARVGFDWDQAEPILDKIEEEISELRIELKSNAPQARIKDELGDLLFAVTNLARRLELDPEEALRAATSKFEGRFKAMEALADESKRKFETHSSDEMELLWAKVKRLEKKQANEKDR